MIPISKVHITKAQEEAVVKVLRSGKLAMDALTSQLEDRLSACLGGAHCVAVANGTLGLTLALAAAGVRPGREVITTAFSFIGTVEPILHLGATPVFADVDPATANIDVAEVQCLLSERTAAILPVHLYGRPADMPRLRALASSHGVPLIEDACQAIGARYSDKTLVGATGTCVFSFYGTKNITSGEGGMITTTEPELAQHTRMLRTHGSTAPYQYQFPGYNARMTDIQAALLMSSVERITDIAQRRYANASWYDQFLTNPDLVKPPLGPVEESCWHQYTLRLHSESNRDDLQRWAHRHGVETRVYYPSALSALPFIRQLGFGRKCPVAERLASTVLSIPVRESLLSDELRHIGAVLNSWHAV